MEDNIAPSEVKVTLLPQHMFLSTFIPNKNTIASMISVVKSTVGANVRVTIKQLNV